MEPKIYLIRHGKTAGNLKKQYIGSTDESLCEEGLCEIMEKAAEGYYPSADVVVSSPMKRAVETARLIYPDREPVIIGEFREMDFGRYEGTTFEENQNDPSYMAWVEGGGKGDFPDGETAAEFSARVAKGWERLLMLSGERKTLAVITHGGVIMELLHRAHPEEAEGTSFRFRIENGEWLEYPVKSV